jgi:peptidyl-prolyl cis-trans isomerase A (cyclophilin A)
VVRVLVETTLGAVVLELDADAAPLTTANFLSHVDHGLYNDGLLHRTVTAENQATIPARSVDTSIPIELIQGGADPAKVTEALQPIPLERTSVTGLSHVDGAISMTRGDVDTAREQFFICVGDQPSLDFGGGRKKDGQGFAAFGRVTSGMEVVRAVQRSPHEGQRLVPPVRLVGMVRLPAR